MTNPPCACLAFSWNLASMAEKTDSEYFGTLLLYLSHVPAGVMWSVVMLSPNFMSALPFNVAASSLATGRGWMFGPLLIVILDGSLAGGSTMEASTANPFGTFFLGYLPSLRGSVITPNIAATTATS